MSAAPVGFCQYPHQPQYVSILTVGQVRGEETLRRKEAGREANAWDPRAPASVAWKPALRVSVVA